MDFKTKFKRQFLKALLTVLSDDHQLKKAHMAYTQNETDERRYNCGTSFGLEGFHKETAVDFSAAVFEALARTSGSFMDHEEMGTHLEELYEEIKSKLVPQLTQGVSVKHPIPEIKGIIQREIESLDKQLSSFNNPYVFYGGLAVVTLAAVTAIALTPSSGPK